MEEVLVKLVGSNPDIEDLKYVLNDSSWLIIEKEDGAYLSFYPADSRSEFAEINAKANSILEMINGAASLEYPDHKKVAIGTIIQKQSNGGSTVFITSQQIQGRSRIRAAISSYRNGVKVESINKFNDWLIIAEKEQSVRDVLHFLNHISWANLYKIYEIIRDDLIGNELNHLKRIGRKDIEKIFLKHGIRYFQELTHFTDVAQSRELLGDEARHASKRIPTPKNNLSLHEAHSIIKKLFEDWIAIKKKVLS